MIALLLAALAAPEALTAADAVARVQAVYDATADLKASFKQTWASEAYGQTRTAYGYVYLRKPGRMRWNYSAPERKAIVSDGTTLWVHEEEDQQVFRQDVQGAGLPAAVAFLAGKGRLADTFTPEIDAASSYGGPERLVLRLTPRQVSADLKALLLVVDPRSWLVVGSVVIDHRGSRNELSFWAIERNTRIPEAKFQFTPPGGVQVIDPRRLLPPP